MNFLNSLISGLSLGSVYAIIALGYTMVYGISKMLNFAHGDVIMVGGYVSFCLTMYMGMNGWIALALAMAVCTLLGITIEIEESECNDPYYGLLLLTSALTLEELRAYVRTDKFAKDMAESFERMIGDCFLIPEEKNHQNTP